MPGLARSFTVVAVDLRGVGESAATESGYDAATLADDVHGLVEALGLGRVHVVGHDIGGWVAFAFARRHADITASATVIETPAPGIEPWLDLDVDVSLWHGEFHMIPDLPEALVTDRQAVYFRYFFDVGTVDTGAIGSDDLEHYAHAYRRPEQLRAAFEFYRAIPENMAFNAEQRGPTDVPLLLVGGENVFGPVLPELADRLRREHGLR
jgi:pimeloyl-ACP methyl ester carboxylesterase